MVSCGDPPLPVVRLTPATGHRGFLFKLCRLRISKERSKRRAQVPRSKLFISNSSQLALRLFSTRHANYFLQDPVPHLFHRFGSIQYSSRVEVDILLHAFIKKSIRRYLDTRSRLAAVNTSSARRKYINCAASGHQSCHADRIVTRSIHETESWFVDGLGIVENC